MRSVVGILVVLLSLVFEYYQPSLSLAQPASEVVFAVPEVVVSKRQIATDVTGQHLMMALESGESTRVFLDGAPLGEAPTVEQLHVKGPERWAYAWSSGEERHLTSNQGSVGPFSSMVMPPVDVLQGYMKVGDEEWGYRGGSRVVMATRSGEGGWVALLRFTASPRHQEVRPLSTVRQVALSPDPWTFSGAPVRFSWVGDAPVAVVRKGAEECLVDGTRKVACGQKIAMFVVAPAGDRYAFTMLQRDGTMQVHTPFGEVPVSGRLDWVSFDPTGEHLLMAFEEKGSWTLWVDGKAHSTWDGVTTAFWTGPGQWAAAVSRGSVSLVVDSKGRETQASGTEGLGFSPAGIVEPLGVGPMGPFVGAKHLGGAAAAIWSFGYTRSGAPFGVVTLSDGAGQSFWFNGTLTQAFPLVRPMGLSPEGNSVAAVGEKDGRATVLLGETTVGAASTDGAVDSLVWCGSGPVLVTQGPKGECAWDAGGHLCCERVLGIGCTEGGVRLLCKGEDGAFWRSAGGSDSPTLGEVLPQNVVRNRWGVIDVFAARLGAQWSLHTAQGEVPLAGPVRQTLAGSDGAWFLVAEGRTVRWWHGGRMEIGAIRIKPPFELAGATLFWAYTEEGEVWVLGGKLLDGGGGGGRILTAPVPFAGGFYYWALVGENLELRKVSGL